MKKRFLAALCALVPLALFGQTQPELSSPQTAFSQPAHLQPDDSLPVRQVVIPHAGVFALDQAPATLEVSSLRVKVELDDTMQRQTWTLELRNLARRPDWARVLVPVQAGFQLDDYRVEPAGSDSEKVEILEAERAFAILLRTADESTKRAPLEWAGLPAIHLPEMAFGAGEVRRLEVRLSAALPEAGDVRVEIPRSELPNAQPVPLFVELTAPATTTAGIYSPSHALRRALEQDQRIARWNSAAEAQPGALVAIVGRPSAETENRTPLTTMVEHDEEGGLLFAVWAEPESLDSQNQAPPAREMTLVVDVSGSMSGTKIRQAREAGVQFLAALTERDSFQILTYSGKVNSLFEAPRPATEEHLIAGEKFVAALAAGGSTHLAGALEKALTAPATEGAVPYVLVLSDGRPTTGLTDERELSQACAQWNAESRRLYTFGIGHDVNAPLLDALARSSRGASAYVTPDADVEQAVATCLQGLELPRWTYLELTVRDSASGALPPAALVPSAPLRDVFEGETLFALGRLESAAPVTLELAAETQGGPIQASATLDPAQAARPGGPLGALYATRRSAELLERIRSTGADSGGKEVLRRVEPEMAELLRISLRSGLLTAHTMFLTLTDTDLLGYDQLLKRLADMLTERVVRARVGRAVFEDAVLLGRDREASTAERVRSVLAGGDKTLQLANVVHLGGHGFFRRGPLWIDGALLGPGSTAKVDEQHNLADPASWPLVDELVRRGRTGLLALPGGVVLDLDGRVIAFSAH